MSIEKIISKLMEQLPDALGAILVDWEGEAIAFSSRMDAGDDDFALKVVGAHNGLILSQLRACMSATVEEVVVATSARTTLIVPVTEDYSLILVQKREPHTGHSLMKMRQSALSLYNEVN